MLGVGFILHDVIVFLITRVKSNIVLVKCYYSKQTSEYE